MNETQTKQDVVDAIDAIRRPPRNLLEDSMSAVRAERKGSVVPRFAALVAIAIAVATIALLVGVASLRRGVAPPVPARPPAGSVICSLPLLTDQGSGLLALPSGAFHSAGVPDVAATAYDQFTHKWLPTQPEGVSPDGKLVAILDNTKGHNLAFRLETSSGKLLYSRDQVMRILGWSSDGSLLVTTVNPAARLLRISPDGTTADWIDPVGYQQITMWSFAAGQYVWGMALPYPDPNRQRIVVRLDLVTRTVTNWYAMPVDSFNDSGGGPILGLTADGYPIVPQLKTDSQPAVYVIRSKDNATPIYVGGSRMTASNFWPFHAVSGRYGTWVATTDGALYGSSDTSHMQRVELSNSIHVFAFGGSCT
jgi:hypothetical protein